MNIFNFFSKVVIFMSNFELLSRSNLTASFKNKSVYLNLFDKS